MTKNLPLFEIDGVLVRLDHVACFIVNANQGIVLMAAMFGVSDCVRNRILITIPEPTERQRIRNRSTHVT